MLAMVVRRRGGLTDDGGDDESLHACPDHWAYVCQCYFHHRPCCPLLSTSFSSLLAMQSEESCCPHSRLANLADCLDHLVAIARGLRKAYLVGQQSLGLEHP